MKKSISKLGKVLKKSEQRNINGSFFDDEYGVCKERFSFSCGVPNHVCCNYMCVLITHPACGF
ncbi:hypothetical protein [Tenacibaculum sp. 190524A05c]|jgi:hypothetical protein|uniref:hypothetical protein n=1 Tax=Tenacibaculum platacis TaxID=3137852 RepID=UPI0031FAC5B7